MTTSKDSGASVQSAPPANPEAIKTSRIFDSSRQGAEKLLASPAGFPVLLGLFIIDLLLPMQGVALLAGVLVLIGLCTEEYTSLLRAKGFHVPALLGLNAGLIPPLIAFTWRPLQQPGISLGLLTIVTLAAVFCTLMVALALVAEVSEKWLRGLEVFALACGGSLVIGAAFAHLLLLRQMTPDPLPTISALAGGWFIWLIGRLKPFPSLPTLIFKFMGLSIISAALFWLLCPRFL